MKTTFTVIGDSREMLSSGPVPHDASCLNFKMAETSESDIDDVEFMEIIREFPIVYNRSLKDFKDRNKKSNCWTAISEKVGQPIDQVKRRYESIRTQFGKYLKSRKGRSGSGSGDIPLDPKYEHLRWLSNYIVSRASSGNFRATPLRCSTPTPANMAVVSENILSEGSNDENNELPEHASDKDEEGEDGDSLDVPVSNHKTTDLSISEVSSKEKPVIKSWVKKESRKRQLEKTDAQLNKAMNNLNESIALHKKSATEEKKMDEDELYVLSLANRLRNLDRRQKAIVRSAVEKVFLDVELGYYNVPQQPQLGSFIPMSPSRLRQPKYVLAQSELEYFKPMKLVISRSFQPIYS